MMQAVHGGGPSVPASTTPTSNAPSGIPKHQRYSSRSNSFSSASIVTVKRAGSLSSTSTGARSSIAQMRAQSPGETSLIALRVSRDQLSQPDKRRKSVAIDSTERSDSDGLGRSHRQSNSTSSSVASGSYARRNRASSGAMLPGLSDRGLSPQKRSAGTIDYSPRASLQKQQHSNPSSRTRYSPAASPERERRRPVRPELTNPLNALPPLHATPALTDPNDTESPSTIQTITTPSTQTSYGPDYFNDDSLSPQKNAIKQKPVMIRKQSDAVPGADYRALQATGGAQQPEAMDESSPIKDATVRETVERRQASQQAPTSEPSTSSRSAHHKSSRTREKGEKDKKVMLSKALEKANTAVLLDNAQNFEGALAAYSDACSLLQQVMDRSSGSDDKRKLEAIKSTYTTRIEELHQLGLAGPAMSGEKSLPPRPMSDDSVTIAPALASPSLDASMSEHPAVGTATSADAATLPQSETDPDTSAGAASHIVDSMSRTSDPTKDASQFQLALEDVPLSDHATATTKTEPKESELSSAARWTPPADDETTTQEVRPLKARSILLPPPQLGRFVPAPLSPKRPPPSPPKIDREPTLPDEPDLSASEFHESSLSRDVMALAPSWLDTIDETTSSCGSSVHSVSSEQGLRRKYLRGVSALSNPDFDAAFDAAVEAAYDEGLEPDMEGADTRGKMGAKHVTNDSVVVRSSEIAEIPSPDLKQRVLGNYNWDSEEDEEERMLDDIAQDYAQSFNFDMSSKSALPRKSDSSTNSRSTWQSSQTSDRATAGTSLSTVAEDAPPTSSKDAFATSGSINTLLSEPLPPLSAPPPQTSLPRPPSTSQSKLAGVRSRRVSSQNMKQLKIETSAATEPRQRASTFHHRSSPFKEDGNQVQQPEFDKHFKFGRALETSTASDTQHEQELHSPPSLDLRSAVSDTSRPATATTTTDTRRSLEDEQDQLRALKPTLVKKDNKSATSLREHMVLLGSPTIDNGPSLLTPLSSTFMNFSSKRNNETPLTSQRAKLPAFTTVTDSGEYSGRYSLFDTSLTATQSASSPKSPTVPVGVEPCPESFLLRPFWLMRNIASTLTHGKGGFLTSRLFVRKEVWQTKGVKLKCLEDKIANCDLLTAALGRLTLVDTYDADAVMEELESFEDVMERVQNALVKKLGSDVGTGGLSSMFKDASAGAMPTSNGSLAMDTMSMSDKASRKEGKGYFNNFLKLRSKSSGPVGGATQLHTKGSEKEALNMSTVPMTSHVPVERRGHKKDVKHLTFDGPNKEYMSSLAKLFDGVQVLDQIARQVEDPGLKGTSQTHVGLELSIRHAAEFFGFYVCRFVLADVAVLLEKHLKRSTEWINA